MNNEKILDFESMTMKQICSCLGLLNKLVEENIIKFDINKSEAVLNYDEAVRCIEKQNKLYKSTLDKIKEYIKEEEYEEEGYGTLVIETKKLNELLEEIK